MQVGFIGLGKLGLPVALCLESVGNHTILGYDISPKISSYLSEKQIPFKEKDIDIPLKNNNIILTSLDDIVKNSEIIFLAIQTPHDPEYEGTTRLPKDRKDFNYYYLKEAIYSLAKIASSLQKETHLVVISTCLPGTFEREIKPILNEYIHYTYNPFFIAMGTVIDDFCNPEFVLLGGEQNLKLEELYRTIHNKPFLWTDIATAEAVKVSYNTFITMKITLANVWGEISQKLGLNFDDIYKAWTMADKRLMGPAYLKAGMGDGGGCHPRDNIALSWLAEEVGLSHNIFEDLMLAREDHTNWLADMIPDGAVIFGKSFKEDSNIETGSPAILLANILKEQGKSVTQSEDPNPGQFNFIATKHHRYKEINWPKGSTVVDPFGYIQDQKDVNIIRIGRK
jgi:UDPglucose 6-dehydrogenase